MGIVTPANNWLAGISKQTNEATVPAVAAYSLPVGTGTSISVVEELRRIAVTDAASIVGDPYKGPQSWAATLSHPAYAASIGRELQAMWPTDTLTGAGPYTHTFSGLGGTQPWIALYSEWPGAAAYEMTFGKGVGTHFSITATQEGGPAVVGFNAVGQEATVAAWTVTTADGLANGYFGLQLTGASILLDVDTPNAVPGSNPEKVRNVTLAVDRPVNPEPTADSFVVTTLGQQALTPSGSMELLWSSWDAYRATYFGSVSGTAASPTLVAGALKLTFEHTLTSAWELSFYVPKVSFRVGDVNPDPSGSPIVLPVTLEIAKPTTGDHIQPVLINAVTTAY